MSTVGMDGTMNIIESPTGKTGMKLVNGLIFQRGYVNPNFVQEESGGNTADMSIELEHPLILVVADKIERVEQVVPILELCKKHKKPLLLFSMDL